VKKTAVLTSLKEREGKKEDGREGEKNAALPSSGPEDASESRLRSSDKEIKNKREGEIENNKPARLIERRELGRRSAHHHGTSPRKRSNLKQGEKVGYFTI